MQRNSNTYANSYGDCYRNGDTNRDSNGNGDCNCNCNSNNNVYGYTHSYSELHAQADPHGKSSADASTAPRTFM